MKQRITPRISLRALLVAFGSFALFLAVYAERANRQHAAVDAIESLGGSVEYGAPVSVVVDRFLALDLVASVEEVRCNRRDAGGGHFVYDIRLLVPHLKRLPRLKRVIVFEINHGADVPTLRRALPGVEIVVQGGGVVG